MRCLALLLCVIFLSAPCWAYPIDAAVQTGIMRLEGYRQIQIGKAHGQPLPSGALLPLKKVELRLSESPEMALPDADPELTEKILAFLGPDQDLYNFALLDLSDPQMPVYTEHQADRNFNPGSLGKIVIAVALFQALADLYPDDIEARLNLLRTRILVADEFILSDHHKVPFWNFDSRKMSFRKIQIGDSGNLYTWLDWMLSPSSNAAAAMVLREYLLIRQFGANYPVDLKTAEEFFSTTDKRRLMRLLIESLREPMQRNGFDPEQLRQGGFFTHTGKKLVPGGSSRANARTLLTLLLRMEQGQLIDPFSSLELKRLLYMTEKRIRYASHPALKNAAVYFKSGSLYSCQSEEGFVCGKYQGNRVNLLNSVAIVEDPQGQPPLRYLIVVSSNVLKVNSAVAHQTLAMRIHRLLQEENRKRLKMKEPAE